MGEAAEEKVFEHDLEGQAHPVETQPPLRLERGGKLNLAAPKSLVCGSDLPHAADRTYEKITFPFVGEEHVEKVSVCASCAAPSNFSGRLLADGTIRWRDDDGAVFETRIIGRQSGKASFHRWLITLPTLEFMLVLWAFALLVGLIAHATMKPHHHAAIVRGQGP